MNDKTINNKPAEKAARRHTRGTLATIKKMESLYHYSSINKLALILESKKIRFNRLDYVNDPHEGVSCDFGSMAIYMFVSCWTKNKEENFALWNMYTDKMRGVRIEIPLPIFNSYKIGKVESNFFVSEDDYLDDNNGLFILSAKNYPISIDYTDDESKLFPEIRTKIGLKTSSLGITKRKIWQIEDEVRYKMEIYPFDPKVPKNNFPEAYEKFIEKRIPPKIDYYDVSLNNDSFEKMKIIIGPKMEPGDKQIIESLVARYNPKAQIIESSLKGNIR
ncbi:hypothetical protein [Marinifilum fragile]|uniref:hypothetical protein n=1 Tax=Marinifilum fragile TaxID=570161 RepID=UPI002AA7E010|nr:hypothetical protein [Marinifilum fragile]